jgi:hypothetical protein
MAVYPINASHPDYSGNIIPTLWSRKLLERFYDAAVVPAISTTDYLGEIKNMGDTVVINQVPDITITAYKMGDTLTNQRPAQTTLELMIDQGNYWAFIMDDVADAQSMFNMTGPWADNASERMKIAVDTEILAFMRTKPDTANKGATAGRISQSINLGTTGAPVALDNTNILDLIIDLGLVLDEQNIPETGRKLVMPMWAAALLKKSDLRNASITGDTVSVLRNGLLGTIDRFEIYGSNLMPTVSDTVGGNAVTASYIYALHPMALTFATQLVKSETIRSELTFGTIMRGLQVYGRGVPQPKAFAAAYIVKG